jgi:hypothetical protein
MAVDNIYKRLSKNKELGEFITTRNSEISFISTNVIVLNLLFGGRVRGGIMKGVINMVSADSAMGKCHSSDTQMRIYVNTTEAEEIKNRLIEIRK